MLCFRFHFSISLALEPPHTSPWYHSFTRSMSSQRPTASQATMSKERKNSTSSTSSSQYQLVRGERAERRLLTDKNGSDYLVRMDHTAREQILAHHRATSAAATANANANANTATAPTTTSGYGPQEFPARNQAASAPRQPVKPPRRDSLPPFNNAQKPAAGPRRDATAEPPKHQRHRSRRENKPQERKIDKRCSIL